MITNKERFLLSRIEELDAEILDLQTRRRLAKRTLSKVRDARLKEEMGQKAWDAWTWPRGEEMGA